MELKNSHGGNAGKSILEKLRDKADEAYEKWMACPEDEGEIWQGRIEGLCDAMALMANTTADLQWNSTEARYEDRQRRK